VTRLWKPWDGDERRRFKGMVGSWGLEPQTSTVSNPDATLNAVTLSETERHV
jgi:hypothetical protein